MLSYLFLGKKAISSIVATILLVLVVVVLVTMIAGLVMPMLEEKVLEFGQSCINAKIRINTKEGYTCFNKDKNEVSVMISHGPDDFNLHALEIILSSQGVAEKFEFIENLPGVNSDKTYNINLSGTHLDGHTIEAAAVAPVVKVGNTNRVCGITSRAKISSCN